MTAPLTIAPPARTYTRARSWRIFQTLFAPIPTPLGSYLRYPEDVPKDADPRRWWTVVDYDPNGPYLHLVPGVTRTNRLGVITCANAWDGNAQRHPLYVYAPR